MRNICLFVIAAVGSSIALSQTPAVAPAVPESPMQVEPSRVYGNMLRTAERALVGLAEAMPEDRYAFAPSQTIFVPAQTTDYKGVRTFAAELAHVVSSNYEYLQAMGLETGKDIHALEAMTGKAELVQALKDSFAAAGKAAAATTVMNVFEGVGPRRTTTRASLLSAICWHTMDHYGQLVEYARMNAIVPPQSR